MSTFTGIGVSSAITLAYAAPATIVLTNTSSFIGTVYAETSLDGGQTWTTPSQSLTFGTMVAGPLTFSFSPPQVSANLVAQVRLHCTAYLSGTLTYTLTGPATAIASGPVAALFGTSLTFSGNQNGGPGGISGMSSTIGIAGTTTNDSAQAGSIGEYLVTKMDTVSATGVADAGTNGPPVASPVLCTLTAASPSFANLQSVFLTGTVFTGASANTNYFITNYNAAAGTFNLSSTLALAAAGTPDINNTVIGTGTLTYHQGSYAASTTAADVMGLALSAGDWDVEAAVFNVLVSTAQLTVMAAWLAPAGGSALPTTSALQFSEGLFQTGTVTYTTLGAMPVAPINGPIRVSLSAPGYVALAYKNTFGTAQVNPQGFIRARRVR